MSYLELAKAKGGFTLNEYGTPIIRKDGYFVALRGHEAKLPVDLSDKSFEALVSAYVAQAKHLQCLVGCWYADYSLYLDLSVWVLDKEQALKCAVENNQQAMYECATGETVYITPSIVQRIKALHKAIAVNPTYEQKLASLIVDAASKNN